MGQHLQALERLFNTVAPPAARTRRLDATALRTAARAAGFSTEAEAVHRALEGGTAHADITGIVSGVVPGSIARWLIAGRLGVSEYALWPVDNVRGVM
jgi:hypothetical protein